MTIEADLTRIADTLEKLAGYFITQHYYSPEGGERQPPAAAPQPVAAPIPTPVIPQPVATAPVSAPAVVTPFPAPPAQPAPAPTGGATPFTTTPELIEWTMNKYKTLGAVKGGQIQMILANMGISSLSLLPPDKFVAFHQAIEAL